MNNTFSRGRVPADSRISRFSRQVALGLLLAGATVLAISWIAIESAHAGKPKPPPLPAMRYTVQFWQAPNGGRLYGFNDMNNHGQVVGLYLDANGSKRGFVYDPAVDPDTAIDLNTIAAAPAGWRIRAALAINDDGMIVGSLSPSDDTQKLGFLLDLTTGTLVTLPNQGSSLSNGVDINESGDVLANYTRADGSHGAYVYNLPNDSLVDLNVNVFNYDGMRMNNPTSAHDTQVTLQEDDGSAYGMPVRWTRGQGFETIPGKGTQAHAINDAGSVGGGTIYKNGGTVPFRYTTSLEVFSNYTESAWDINSSGDLLGGHAVYQDAWGFLSITSLIDTTDPDAPEFLAYFVNGAMQMNDRLPAVGFGEIVGGIQLPDGVYGFLLTPVPH